MLAYKGFQQGLKCRDYQFSMGMNVTDQANCRRNGFHCAANPLDCLTYYPDIHQSEYYLVNAGGDLDEDNVDSKISCTELTILRKLEADQLLLHGLAYMEKHPLLPWSPQVKKDCAWSSRGYVVVRGRDPVAQGELGDLLALAQESRDGKRIDQIALIHVDGEKILPRVWYGSDLEARGRVIS